MERLAKFSVCLYGGAGGAGANAMIAQTGTIVSGSPVSDFFHVQTQEGIRETGLLADHALQDIVGG